MKELVEMTPLIGQHKLKPRGRWVEYSQVVISVCDRGDIGTGENTRSDSTTLPSSRRVSE